MSDPESLAGGQAIDTRAIGAGRDRHPPDVVLHWAAEGEPPPEVLPRLIAVARTLAIPLERLDLGPHQRGFREGDYAFVLIARGHDDQRWRARLGAWSWPEPGTEPDALVARASSRARAIGPTADAALGTLEAELRALVRGTGDAADADAPSAPRS